MKAVFSALASAFNSLLHPRMLALLLLPMLLSLILWAAAAVFFWASWVEQLSSLIRMTPVEQWLATGVFAILSHYLIAFVLIMFLLPAVYVTALVITAIFVMPMMVDHVVHKRYRGLVRKQGGSALGSVWNSLFAIIVYCTGWLLVLPLWLFWPVAIVLPVILFAYLNQRLFCYDALAEHASRAEYLLILNRCRGRLFLLGIVTGLLQYVPLLNLVSPVYIGLAFIHLCLEELKKLREENGSKSVGVSEFSAGRQERC